jgi:membrane-associated protease RseP (regulator of RpoE activity)
MITAITVLIALGILGWGFYRARSLGKMGILAWLQSAVLMAPWLLFFGLFAAGIYLNIVGVLFLFVLSVGAYILIGKRLRVLSQEAALAQRVSTIARQEIARQEIVTQEIATQEIATTDPAKLEAKAIASEKPSSEAELEILPIPDADLKAIQGIFGVDTFFATATIPYQEGAIFRGNLRGEVEPTFARLSENLRERLDDRYRLFLVENPEGKPVVIVLPSSRDPQPLTLAQKSFAIGLMLATIATCLESAGFMLDFDLALSPDRLGEALPLALGLLTILTAHEVGHWLMARRHQVHLSLPFFIPTLQIGSLGAINRFESTLPNRSVLFDVAFAGPAVGGLISLGMLVIGLLISHAGNLFKVPTEFFQGSILVGTLARVVLRESLQQPFVDVHPLVILGWLGLVINALSLLPAGQLDGGRIVQAIYGRKTAGRTTLASLVLLGLAALVNPLALYWAIVVLFLQRELERPSLNELTEPNDARAALALLGLFLMIVTLIPLTPSLAGRLGIGT